MLFSDKISSANLQLKTSSSTELFADTPFLAVRNVPGWNGIELEYYQALPGIIGQQFKQHLALIFFSQGKIKQKLEENTILYNVVPGSIILIPASIFSQISWLQPLDFAVLILKPSAITQAIEELNLELNRVVLSPQFEQKDNLVHDLLLTLLSEMKRDRQGCSIYIETLTKTLVVHLFKKYAFTTIWTTQDKEFSLRVIKAIAYINENLDKKLYINEIAATVNISKYYFCRVFNDLMGISPYQYLLQQRIEKAKTLLRSNIELSIVDISLKCGFASQSHFAKCFRKYTGTTAKTYRDRALCRNSLNALNPN